MTEKQNKYLPINIKIFLYHFFINKTQFFNVNLIFTETK